MLVTVTGTGLEVVMFPAASRARAVTTCGPGTTVVVFHCREYGAAVTSAPSATPSMKNCTPATPVSSEAVAVTVTVLATVAFAAGAMTATVGGVVSPLAA